MSPSAQSDEQMRGEVAFRRFHQQGVNKGTLAYMRLACRERRGLFHDLALRGATLSPFLELGAETGANSLLLTNDLHADGLALDLSRDALAALPAYAAELRYDRQPHRAWGDAHGLPLRNGALPFAVVWGTLHHFTDPRPVLAELRRVLAPGALLLVGDEPVRRRLSLHLTRTRTLAALPPWQRLLLRAHLLPWAVDVDGREAVDAGATEMQFARRTYKQMLAAAFERVELTDHPYVTATIRSAGPLARLLLWPLGPVLSAKAQVAWFGGAIGARCWKEPGAGGAWLDGAVARPLHLAPAGGPRSFLLRKRVGHDCLALHFAAEPEALKVFIDGEAADARPSGTNVREMNLPPAAVLRGTIRLDLDSPAATPLAHIVFTGERERTPLWSVCAAPEPPAPDIAGALACPACWTVAPRCRADLCGTPCLAFGGGLARAGLQVAVRDHAAVDPRAVAACPVAAIDRPALVPASGEAYLCSRCQARYAVTGGIADLLTPRARKALG